MKAKRVYTDYLRDILDAAEKVTRFVEGVDFEAFRANDEKVLAVTCGLEIIGEAASQVSQPCRDGLPGIRWRSIVGMRHSIVHAYHDVNLTIVWKTVQEDLPPLIEQIEPALAGEEEMTR